MEIKKLNPRLSLNKAFLKAKPNRLEMDFFKVNLISLLDHINENESEEFHKNLVSDFLKNTYYANKHYINTKDRKDLVIHNGVSAISKVGVIIEAKKPTNKSEMIKPDNINCKAFQELVLYYLRERITHNNIEIKHLIATNITEWYVFDAFVFEREFAQNKALVKKFIDFEEGRAGGYKTDFFYTEIAAPAISSIIHEISFSYFDIRDYEKPLRNNDPNDDNQLIALFKLLSPEHLLKLPFANDSNSLDKTFYTELLHIIGLTETKDGGKKLIQRKLKRDRNPGSLIESAIVQLDNLDKISRLDKPEQYGDSYEDRLFNVALELVITWINRILFLKLLEAQLLKYHKGDKQYAFLNTDKIKNYDSLNTLFFQVLAKKVEERNETIAEKFKNIPYLNSSLFEPTELEHNCFFIAQLEHGALPLLANTVIKNNVGKKLTGEIDVVNYIFDFLNAYDFSSEGSEEIQEDNKRLINASVLGLIFEKINGYKDGSFFTPGFITMYMCRQTIRRAVVQIFNDLKGWNCKTTDDLYDKIDDRKEANNIINSLKLCDPAVGSGHFLVSALNEMIAIKSELRILSDREGKRLKEYSVVVENDELIVTDEDGKLYEYHPTSKESQRVQEALFHEKQTIIENCLFGVDLNPNSVKICRLRLWIELLKNAYYKFPSTGGVSEGRGGELETLPNIDINIKCGNSLISRYALDADIKKALKRSKWTIESYRLAVMTYRNAQSKDEKRAMERLINEIKSDFVSEIAQNDKRLLSLNTLRGELYDLSNQTTLFEQSKAEKAKFNKAVEEKAIKIEKLERELEEIRTSKIYEKAFEWRFEFPEVLNDDGDFIGFDVVIGNPPYVFTKEADFSDSYKDVILETLKTYNVKTESKGLNIQTGKINLFGIFLIRSFSVLKRDGELNYIIPNNILRATTYEAIRIFLLNQTEIIEIVDLGSDIFPDATVATVILSYKKALAKNNTETKVIKDIIDFELKKFTTVLLNQSLFRKNISSTFNILLDPTEFNIIKKIDSNSERLETFFKYISPGIDGDKDKFVAKFKKSETFKPLLYGKDFGRYVTRFNDNYIEYDRQKLNRAREEYIFLSPKIIIQRISGGNMPLTVTVDTENYYTFNSVNNLVLKDGIKIPLEFFAGILNSKLINWYYSIMFSNKSTLTVNISKTFLAELPIKIVEKENISIIVKNILALKSKDSTADTTTLESQIDQLVYKLYDLTEEEIKIVEG